MLFNAQELHCFQLHQLLAIIISRGKANEHIEKMEGVYTSSQVQYKKKTLFVAYLGLVK